MDKKDRRKRTLYLMAVLIGILLVIFLLRQIGVLSILSVITGALSALIYGLFIACLLYPIATPFEKLFLKVFVKDGRPRKGLARALSVTLAEIILVLIFVLALVLIIPQLAISLGELVPSMESLASNFQQWLQGLSSSEMWTERIYPAINTGLQSLVSWVMSTFGESSTLFQAISSGLMSVVSVVMNIFVGMVLSIYLLLSRETLLAQTRKLFAAILGGGREKYFMEAVGQAGYIFSGYFAGKVLEAVIVGVICFIGMMILKLPYATLISVIVGITNIIPFFGGYIGSIAGTLILLLIEPVSALIFLIFIMILLQVDGNFIGPKVLGGHTGLPALWVVVSILFFGGLFGFMGTLLGVPIFAWIYYVVKRIVEHTLKKRGLPYETKDYMDKDE